VVGRTGRDELLNFFGHLPLPNATTPFALANNLITGQCFTEDSNEWTVSREKNGVSGLIFVAALRGDVKTDQRFARPRNTG
jgi:hypothetical protein